MATTALAGLAAYLLGGPWLAALAIIGAWVLLTRAGA
jgi:hypothetical protein